MLAPARSSLRIPSRLRVFCQYGRVCYPQRAICAPLPEVLRRNSRASQPASHSQPLSRASTLKSRLVFPPAMHPVASNAFQQLRPFAPPRRFWLTRSPTVSPSVVSVFSSTTSHSLRPPRLSPCARHTSRIMLPNRRIRGFPGLNERPVSQSILKHTAGLIRYRASRFYARSPPLPCRIRFTCVMFHSLPCAPPDPSLPMAPLRSDSLPSDRGEIPISVGMGSFALPGARRSGVLAAS